MAPQQAADHRLEFFLGVDERVGAAHDARLVGKVDAVDGARRRRHVESQEAGAAGPAGWLAGEGRGERLGLGDDEVVGPIAERNLDERRRVGVDVEQIGDDAADATKRPVRILLGLPKDLFGARGEAFQAAFEFFEDDRPLAGAGEPAFEVGDEFVERRDLAAVGGELGLSPLELLRRLL